MAAAYAPRSRLTSSNVVESSWVSPCEDQKVSAFLDGSFGYVHESRLVSFAATTESLGDVGRNGYCCTTHLQRKAVGLLLGKRRGGARLQELADSLTARDLLKCGQKWLAVSVSGHERRAGLQSTWV
jgi:hypothetical protein